MQTEDHGTTWLMMDNGIAGKRQQITPRKRQRGT